MLGEFCTPELVMLPLAIFGFGGDLDHPGPIGFAGGPAFGVAPG